MADQTSLAALMDWYAARCDGQWEHQYGVRIDTLDNPGWLLTIDLADTELENAPFSPCEHQLKNDQSWWRCWREGAVFHATCGARDLDAVIGIFLDFVATLRPTT
jgi:hypothetical protein